MQRKDYELVARIVREGVELANAEGPKVQYAQRAALWRFVTNFASEAARDNSRFDRNRFVAACGFTPLSALRD